jgi:hypothetical protein
VFSKEAPLRAALAAATKFKPKFTIHVAFASFGAESDGLLALSCLQQRAVLSPDRDMGLLFRADAQDPKGLLMSAISAKGHRVLANDREGMRKMYSDARVAATSKRTDVTTALDAAVLSLGKLATTVRFVCFFLFIRILFIYLFFVIFF